MQNPFYLGPRMYFRPLEREDAPRVAGFFNNPEVRRNLLRYRPLTVGQEVAFLERIASSEQDVVLGVMLREGDRLTGLVGLHELDFRDRRASFGIALGEPSEWGKGYGSEATRMMMDYAFGTLNLNRVTLHVFEDNLAGIRAYEKAGFQREGVLRQHHYNEGRYVDTLAMGVLRSEWKPLPALPR